MLVTTSDTNSPGTKKDAELAQQKKTKIKTYEPGETVFKKDKQIKKKNKPIYKKETVGKDNNVTITTSNNRKIHKSHLKIDKFSVY